MARHIIRYVISILLIFGGGFLSFAGGSSTTDWAGFIAMMTGFILLYICTIIKNNE